MSRLILTTLLFTIVFSWEDMKRSLVWVLGSFKKQKNNYNYDARIDEIVGLAIIFATLPANLVYLLIGDGSLLVKLAIIFTELLLIGVLAEILEIIATRAKKYRHSEVLSLAGTFILGIFTPTFRSLITLTHYRKLFGIYLRHLAVPITFGISLKVLTNKFGPDYIQKNLDPLIITVIAAMFLMMTTEILENFFRFYPMRLPSYFRIALGIVIIFMLGNI